MASPQEMTTAEFAEWKAELDRGAHLDINRIFRHAQALEIRADAAEARVAALTQALEDARATFCKFFDAMDKAAKQDGCAGDSSVEITLYGWDEYRAALRVGQEDEE